MPQVKVSPPKKKSNINVPDVNSIKVSQQIPKVNLNLAQHAKYETKLPQQYFEPPHQQIERLKGGDANPLTEFYQERLVSLYELPHRLPGNWIIPIDLNQNRFLASPLNARGEMQTTTIFDVNLLRTNMVQ